MRKLVGLVAALAVGLGLAFGAPAPCVACSCVAPVSLAEAVTRSPDLGVFVGKVVALDGGARGTATVVVDGRFRGPLLRTTIRARYGGGGDCTIGMSVGERRLFTASLGEDGVWFPAMCDPQGVQGTLAGDALIAEAIRTFGPAQAVGGPPIEPSAGLPLGSVAVALGIILLLATGLVVAVALAARG